MNALALILFSLSTAAFASSDISPTDPLPPGYERTPNPGKFCPNEAIYPVAIKDLTRNVGNNLVAGSIRMSPQMPENILKEMGGTPLVAVYKRLDGTEWIAQFALNYESCEVIYLHSSVLSQFD